MHDIIIAAKSIRSIADDYITKISNKNECYQNFAIAFRDRSESRKLRGDLMGLFDLSYFSKVFREEMGWRRPNTTIYNSAGEMFNSFGVADRDTFVYPALHAGLLSFNPSGINEKVNNHIRLFIQLEQSLCLNLNDHCAPLNYFLPQPLLMNCRSLTL